MKAGVLLLLCLSACASVSTYTPPLQRDHTYRPQPCTKGLTNRAYQELLKGGGSAECALYYFRCRKPPDIVLELRKFRARRRY